MIDLFKYASVFHINPLPTGNTYMRAWLFEYAKYINIDVVLMKHFFNIFYKFRSKRFRITRKLLEMFLRQL